MTKFDWNEMKRAKAERQKREKEFLNLVGFACQVSGAFFLIYISAAVLG